MAKRGESDTQADGEEPTVIVEPSSSASDGTGPQVDSVREAASLLKDPVAKSDAAGSAEAKGDAEPGANGSTDDVDAKGTAAADGDDAGAEDEESASATDKAKESAKAAGEKAAAVAGEATEQAKEQGRRARKKLAAAASGAKDRASSAASDARERAAGTDVHELAKTTSGLIANTRPFFLAGCALLFALLGFFEGDSGTGQFFVFGSIVFVLGAAFSGELAGLAAGRRGTASADEPSDE